MESQDGNFTDQEGSINFNISSTINGPALAVALGIEMVLGIIANLFVIIFSFWHTKTLKKSSTILLLFLAGANLFCCFVYMPFQIITAALHEWIFGKTVEVREGFCIFVGYISSYVTSIIYYILGAISFDRFLMIVKPITHRRFIKPVVVIIIVIAIAIFVALYAALPFFGIGVFTFSPIVFTCGSSWEGQRLRIIITLFVGAIPIVTIIITSGWTFLFTRSFIKSDYRQRKLSIRTKDGGEYQKSIYDRRMKKLIGIFGMLLIVNTISVVPFVLVATIGSVVGYSKIPDPFYGIIMFLFFLNNIGNPMVQCYFRPELKKTLIACVKYIMMACKCGKVTCKNQNKEKKYSSDHKCDDPEAPTSDISQKTDATDLEQ